MALPDLKSSCVDMPEHQQGLLVTLEGGEGVGKSTAAEGLAAVLRAEGHVVLLTREPGGTKGAEAIRTLLLDQSIALTPLAQTMLHFAARVDHVELLIRPALARGEVVICDRFYDSTMAYQAYGQGVAESDITAMIQLVGLRPDVTFLLDVPTDIAQQRLTKRARAIDRYEGMGAAFFQRVQAGFRSMAEAEPMRFVQIDASAPAAEIVARLRQSLRERVGL